MIAERHIGIVLIALFGAAANAAAQEIDGGEPDAGVPVEVAIEEPDAGVVPPIESIELPSTPAQSETEPAAVEAQPDITEPEQTEALGGIEDIEEIDLAALLSGQAVLSVSRSFERIDDAPAAVTVITRDQIRLWGYQSVAEVLDHVVGFYSIDDHILPNVGVRGVSGGLRAESGLLKVMIDGRSVAFRSTGGNWLGPELIPMSVVERIEIIRGPASTVYGADAFLGVINVITRDPERLNGAEIWGTGSFAGSFGGGMDLALGGRTGEFSAILALRIAREDRSGIRLPLSSPAPQLLANIARDRQAQALALDSASVFSRITYHIDSRNTIALTGQLSGVQRNGEFADWLQLSSGLDQNGRQRGNAISLLRGYLDLPANLRFSDELALTATATFFAGAPTGNEHIDVGSNVYYVRREMNSYAGQGETNLQWRPVPELTITFGGDWLVDRQTLPGTLQILMEPSGMLAAGDVREETSVRQGTREFVNLGLLALANWNPIDRLRLNAGGRFDYNNIYGAQFNFRVGGSVRIFDELSVKAYYSSAFRAPTTQLLYGVPLRAGDILANSTLRPQRIHTWEADVSLTPWEWMRVQTAISYNYLSDLAAFVPVGANQVARNIAEQGVWAWETDARVSWEQQLNAYANFALVLGTRNLQDEGYRAQLIGGDLPVYPPAILNFGLSWTFREFPLRFGAEGRLISERRASDQNIIANGAAYSIPTAFYLDVNVSLVEIPILENRPSTFMFVVRNLLDNQTAHPGFAGIDYPSAPRLFMLQWQQRL